MTHRIYTEGGCFQWSASNDIVVLEERNLETSGEGECSDAVDVSIAPSFVFTTRSHTWIQVCFVLFVLFVLLCFLVLSLFFVIFTHFLSLSFLQAVEARTGKILTCEVYVDRISKIAIETTTRTMFKGDLERFSFFLSFLFFSPFLPPSPSYLPFFFNRLTVLAFDEVGNLFSNIEGLKFQWTINPVHSVLQLAQDGIADAIVTYLFSFSFFSFSFLFFFYFLFDLLLFFFFFFFFFFSFFLSFF